MLDINAMRAEYARYLTDNYHQSRSLDAALMHVVSLAYSRGLADGRAEALRKPEPEIPHWLLLEGTKT